MAEKISEDVINIAKEYNGKKEYIIEALHKVQDKYGYVSEEVQKYFAKEFGMPVSEVYGIVTFYSRFSLLPKGKYHIEICMGTACYVKGAEAVYNRFRDVLKIEDGMTTQDGMFSLAKVRCIGACGLAPAISINGEVYGKVTPKMVDEIIAKYKNM